MRGLFAVLECCAELAVAHLEEREIDPGILLTPIANR